METFEKLVEKRNPIFHIDLDPQQNIKNYKTMNFENMSKRMVLNNLNKVIITKDGIIEEIVNFTDLELFLKNN